MSLHLEHFECQNRPIRALTGIFSLALAEMKTLLRDVYSRFTTVPDESMTEDDMQMADLLISSQPKGMKCHLRLLPLGKDGTLN